MIVVEKGRRRNGGRFARDSNTKVSGDLKVGEKVTVHYTMTAKDVEVKAGKAKKAASPAASPKK